MALPVFPAQALDGSVITTVFVGLCVITFFNLRFGTTMAGLVVPGYLVPLLLLKPMAAFVIWGEAIVTYVLARLLADHMMRRTGSCTMFGRDRFFALLLLSVLVRVVSDGWVLPAVGQRLTALGWAFDYHNNLYSFGLVIIALVANQMWNAGLARGMRTFVLHVGLTYVIVRWLLVPFTNFDLAGLSFLYEGIAQDILASPKAYIILLTTAFIASRMNLHYGWEFSGILIPALLALQWFQPSKLLISLLEAALIYGLGHAALKLPVFRRANMEGSRLLLLFFAVGYLYKIGLAHLLGWLQPTAKVSDFFAFGYLVSTLLAVKMHQKQLSWQMSRTTLQTSLMGLAVASVAGYGLALAWPASSSSAPVAARTPATALQASTASLDELLATHHRALYASETARVLPGLTPAQLGRFDEGVRGLLRYRLQPTPSTLSAARAALQGAGFLVERSGEWLVIHDADPARGGGVYAINLAPRTAVAVQVPAPLDEPGTFEAAVSLASADGYSSIAAAGTRRDRLPDGRSNVLQNAQLPFGRFHALTSHGGVLQVRGLASPLGADPPARLWVQRTLPEGVSLQALRARLGAVEARFDRRPVANRLRDATDSPFAELLLPRAARLRLVARTLHGMRVQIVAEPQRVDGYLYAWLVDRPGAIAGAGSGRYVPPARGDLLYLQSEIIEPLLAVADQWSRRRDEEALRAIHASAANLGYQLVLHRQLGSGIEHLILTEIPGGRRHWGTLVLRLGDASGYLVEIPRPGAERHTIEYGARLFARLDARALLVAGAHHAVRSDGLGNVLDPDNRFTVFNAVHQSLVMALSPDAWILQVRGRRAADPRPAPDVVMDFVGKPAALRDAPRVADLLAVLGGEADTVAIAGQSTMAPLRDNGTDAQALFVRDLSGPRFLTLSVTPQARRAYRDMVANDPEDARFRAAGVPTVHAEVAERLRADRFIGPPPTAVRELVDGFVASQNVVALASARRSVPSLQRVVDLASGRTFLRVGAADGRAMAWRSLDPGADPSASISAADRQVFAAGNAGWLFAEAEP